MKHLRLLLVALLIIPAALQAQEGSSTTVTTPRSSAGDFALLFDLGGLTQLALNGFNPTGADTNAVGAGFGAKYFIADDLALRLGLVLQSNAATQPGDSATAVDEFSVFRFAIAPSVVVNVMKTGAVAGYLGGQVGYAMSSSERTTVATTEPDVEVSSSAFSVAGIIGAEWFPWSSVSLSAEYQLGYGMSSSEETRTVEGQNPQTRTMPDETSFALGSRGVLAVGIYW